MSSDSAINEFSSDIDYLSYASLAVLEEAERSERMNVKVDPVLMANRLKVQDELLRKNFGKTMSNNFSASMTRGKYNLRESSKDFSEKVSDFVDSARGKMTDVYNQIDKAQEDFAVQTNEGAKKFMDSLNKSSEAIGRQSTEFSVQANNLAQDIKDAFTGVDMSSAAAEEKERLRRMNEKIDPVVEGRKHRVEGELLSSVKLVN